MKKRFFTIAAAAALAILTVVAPTSAVIPADHFIRQIAKTGAADHILKAYLMQSQVTTGQEVADVHLSSVDGNGQLVFERNLVRREVFAENGFNEVRLEYEDTDRTYVVRQNGEPTQEVVDGGLVRKISARGNLPNMAYAPSDLRIFRRDDYVACSVLNTDNDLLRISCTGGPYPRIILTLDLVDGRLAIVEQTMYDEHGQIVKIETRLNWVTLNGKPRPSTIIMEDWGRNRDPGFRADNLTTTVTLTNWRSEDPPADDYLDL